MVLCCIACLKLCNKGHCFEILNWQVNNDASSDGGFEAVFLENIAAKKGAPTVLILHGGPHAIFLNAYLMSNLYFNILGYNILQVNYR